MNHAITIAGLLLSLGLLGGILMIFGGVIALFAAGMSDAGDDGTGKNGCIILVIGAVLFVACLIGLFA